MGERPAKGILMVAISHRMRAKLYISAALLSMSSGLCCRAGETKRKSEPYGTGLQHVLATYNIKTQSRSHLGGGFCLPR